MKAYLLPLIYGVDEQSEPCILASHGDMLKLPITEIKYPEFFQREILTITANFFKAGQMDFIDECNYNFLDIQSDLAMTYVHKYYREELNKEDLVIIYGGLLKYMSCIEGLGWHPLLIKEQHGGFTVDKDYNLLLSDTMQKMRI